MKIVYYIPAILFTMVYGWLAASFGFGGVSPIAFVWMALLFGSAVLLSYEKFWGSIFGMLTGTHWIYMSTIDTGQVINIELPLGLIMLLYFTLCGGYGFHKSRVK